VLKMKEPPRSKEERNGRRELEEAATLLYSLVRCDRNPAFVVTIFH
jgi:hypothetical protein